MPSDGEDLYQHFQKKYGMSREKTNQLGTTLRNHGRSLEFEFNYPAGNRMRNSFLAHQLLAWAKPQGLDTRLCEALFAAYFTDQQDIASSEVLLGIAEAVGLNPVDAETALSRGAYSEAVKTEEQYWLSNGVHAVPAVILDNRFLISGARSVEEYEQQISRASGLRTTESV